MTQVVEISVQDQQLWQEYLALCFYAFDRVNNDGRAEKLTELGRHSHTYVMLDDQGEVKSGLMVTNLPVNWHGQEFLMGAVGYVATYPEFGGQGAISQLMSAAYTQMAADGVYLSYLAPFSFTFYRRFGYEQVFDQVVYELASRDFPRLPKVTTGRVERGSFLADLPLMADLYGKSYQSQQGGVVRATWWQEYRFSKHPRFEVAFSYDDADQADGYLLYERTTGETFTIVELMTTTPASQMRLLQFAGKHVSSYQELLYVSGNQTVQNDLLPEAYQLTTKVQPYMMASVVDWAGLIAEWHFTADLTTPIILAIADDFYPANAGLWQLTVNNGRGKLTPTEATEIDLRIDTRQLTKVVLGYRTLATLQQRGEIQAESAVLQALQNCVNYAEKPMLWDYF
ncbi:MAG: GNAT family N-acetyltransferase [Lactobacillaceae bacterium]|jgi:predicted acetyltransferase|nr:GNAT family N-acetyltransferase [Lactobacillaceae bacterium]